MLSSLWCLWKFSPQQQWRLYTHNSNFSAGTYQSQIVHIILEDKVCYTVSPRNVFVLKGNKVQLYNKRSWITNVLHLALTLHAKVDFDLYKFDSSEPFGILTPIPKGLSFIQLNLGSHFISTTTLSFHPPILTWDHVRSGY